MALVGLILFILIFLISVAHSIGEETDKSEKVLVAVLVFIVIVIVGISVMVKSSGG